MLDEDFTREELFEKFPTARTFPQITAHGEYIGGFTEFGTVVTMAPEEFRPISSILTTRRVSRCIK